MLLHLVGNSLGTAIRNGRTLHGYKAKCGAIIAAVVPLTIGSQISTGPEPHALCAKCFAVADPMNVNIDVTLPEGRLDGAVYDEHGNQIKGQRVKDDFAGPLGDTVQRRTEDYPYGVPIRRL
jgi:hypothetical protein